MNDVLYQLSHATKFCYRFLCNLHIPSAKGVLQGLEARSLCNPYRMDYQLSHATIFFLMTLPSTSNIMPQTSEFVNREISKNYFSCASQPFIRNGKGKKKENKRLECQKSGGAGGTAATQSSRRTTAVVPARFVSHLRVANRLRRLCPPGDR